MELLAGAPYKKFHHLLYGCKLNTLRGQAFVQAHRLIHHHWIVSVKFQEKYGLYFGDELEQMLANNS